MIYCLDSLPAALEDNGLYFCNKGFTEFHRYSKKRLKHLGAIFSPCTDMRQFQMSGGAFLYSTLNQSKSTYPPVVAVA